VGRGCVGRCTRRWVERGRDGWGAGVTDRYKKRLVGRCSDGEVQWAMGGARV